MKVLLINGSPHEKGCTYTALLEVSNALAKRGVGSDFLHVGTKPIAGMHSMQELRTDRKVRIQR